MEPPCLPLISFLTGRPDALAQAVHRLRDPWPTLRLTAPGLPFEITDYYREEMGEGLVRWWGHRPRLADPTDLPAWKRTTRRVEEHLNDPAGNRTVNIDPGYLNYGLVVLASHKPGTHRIPIGSDVYADAELYYSHGSFDPLPWSFPDFRDGRHDPTLEDLRARYRSLREN